jgi:hypothetical protein
MSQAREFSRQDVEGLLRSALQPVEPNERFVRRLRARLVRYRGRDVPTVWAVVGGLAIATLLVFALFGTALRFLLQLLGTLGLLQRSGGNGGARPSTT